MLRNAYLAGEGCLGQYPNTSSVLMSNNSDIPKHPILKAVSLASRSAVLSWTKGSLDMMGLTFIKRNSPTKALTEIYEQISPPLPLSDR